MSAGTVTSGFVVSCTLIVKEPGAVLWGASVAEHLTWVLPIGNSEPEAGVQVTSNLPSTRSSAVAVKDTAVPDFAVASTTMLAGRVSFGAVVSCTVTSNECSALLPCESTAVQATVVIPTANTEPEAGAQVTGTESPSTMSVAVGAA